MPTNRRSGSRLPIPADAPVKRKRGYSPRPVIEFPEPLSAEWTDVDLFHEALIMHMARFGDTCWHLFRAIARSDEPFSYSALVQWSRGNKLPRSVTSFSILARIEHRYRLPSGYFKAKLSHPARASTGRKLRGISAAERRRLAWHLPDDFEQRTPKQQEEILHWVRNVIISGSTEYRRFQARAMRQRYALRFWDRATAHHELEDEVLQENDVLFDADLVHGTVPAPMALNDEMAELLRFKTATFAPIGLQRNGVWGHETSAQRIEHLGLLFGSLAASPRSAIRGCGVPLGSLSFALLLFPAVWDWYLQWREKRRGFYTAWEIDMLRLAQSFTRPETGWLRQHPGLGDRLQPIRDLLSTAEIEAAQADWLGACDRLHKHAGARARELQRIARVHRDPFEPIIAVLEAESPVAEYRKITQEIVRLMPDAGRYPRPAAEAVRSLLMLRFGLHLGLRQRNMRELLVCRRGDRPRTERQLETEKRGEIRWSDRDQGWEVLIPAIAFKNSMSSFFGSKPFRLVLPDLDGLYGYISAYIDQHRPALLRGAEDPGTFFVKTMKVTSRDAAFDQNKFYEAWRLIIQRYGIYNPFTGRGAIKGLLPHGPHNVRDVLATHILKKTGSYEQASYAIQDTPDMVAKHYGRFLPQDKAALAAQILNQVWT